MATSLSSTRSKPPARGQTGPVDPARRVAYELLRAVDEKGAFANLALPGLLRNHRLDTRDAALATELGYGTLRAQGTLDGIIDRCSTRPVAQLDPPIRDILRLGAYQLLRTRVPSHAAVSATVDLARGTGNVRAAGLVNAVLRKIDQQDWSKWTDDLTVDQGPLARVAARYAHPMWIAQAFATSLGVEPDSQELELALAADDTRPQTHLIARPGLMTRAELLTEAGPDALPGPFSPYSVHLDGGDPGALASIRDGRSGVQDEGSQLCAIALASAELTGPDERWLDMCAGPGGKAALLAALAQERGARLDANELREHRAELVRQAVAHWDVTVTVGDAATIEGVPGGYDRILLDAPCTGLGALRRRPEARWRRTPDDLAELTALQARLLTAATRLVRPGGVIAYVTCSPHPAETTELVTAALTGGELEALDARGMFPGLPELGEGPFVQMWPHRDGTDAMFAALLRRM
ncbi:MAG: rsmB [Pseudonocardiales bacterium]|nr:rsmB [Pseudonocardiales bacterium]